MQAQTPVNVPYKIYMYQFESGYHIQKLESFRWVSQLATPFLGFCHAPCPKRGRFLLTICLTALPFYLYSLTIQIISTIIYMNYELRTVLIKVPLLIS
jgi:hypothetical protein